MDRSLNALNATDLNGKNWTIAELKGKTTLINVWAACCSPCRDELPFVQKLYERVKDRNDIQVITIGTDENPGILAPFLEKEHYTFPALPAKTLVDDLVREVSIPRTWIVEPDRMMARLQEVR